MAVEGMSWVYVGFFFVFFVICMRYRKNSRYLTLMLNDVMEMRERHNAFDDTLRETTFVWLLNLLWCGSAGVALYGLTSGPLSEVPEDGEAVARLGVCMGISVVFTLFQTVAYATVGNVFTDGSKASFWVKGHLSTQALATIALFPVAIFGLSVPGLLWPMAITGFIIFVIAKILFIYKGFCIFFAQSTSWVLFLYYLCSLEIVPIVLTYAGALYLCRNLLV